LTLKKQLVDGSDNLVHEKMLQGWRLALSGNK
jgi:hypothetical protein